MPWSSPFTALTRSKPWIRWQCAHIYALDLRKSLTWSGIGLDLMGRVQIQCTRPDRWKLWHSLKKEEYNNNSTTNNDNYYYNYHHYIIIIIWAHADTVAQFGAHFLSKARVWHGLRLIGFFLSQVRARPLHGNKSKSPQVAVNIWAQS